MSPFNTVKIAEQWMVRLTKVNVPGQVCSDNIWVFRRNCLPNQIFLEHLVCSVTPTHIIRLYTSLHLSPTKPPQALKELHSDLNKYKLHATYYNRRDPLSSFSCALEFQLAAANSWNPLDIEVSLIISEFRCLFFVFLVHVFFLIKLQILKNFTSE